MNKISASTTKKMGAWAASIQMATAAWAILKTDKKLLWFPILSGVINLVLFCMVGTTIFLAPESSPLHLDHGAFSQGNSVYLIGAGFLYYLIYYLIVNFFTAGLFVLVHGRFIGQNLSFSDGIKAAVKNFNKIFLWSVVMATVGMILQLIAEKFQLFQRIIAYLLGASWHILTYFSLPVMVVGQQSLIDSFKESAHIIRKVWGETAIVILGVSGLFFLPCLIVGATIPFVAHFFPHYLAMDIIAVIVFIIVMSIIGSTLSSIFKIALYEYATTGKVPEGFSAALMENAVKKL